MCYRPWLRVQATCNNFHEWGRVFWWLTVDYLRGTCQQRPALTDSQGQHDVRVSLQYLTRPGRHLEHLDQGTVGGHGQVRILRTQEHHRQDVIVEANQLQEAKHTGFVVMVTLSDTSPSSRTRSHPGKKAERISRNKLNLLTKLVGITFEIKSSDWWYDRSSSKYALTLSYINCLWRTDAHSLKLNCSF